MRSFMLFFFLTLSIVAQEFAIKHWPKGLSFGEYIEQYNIDASRFYAKVNPEDLKFLSLIEGGALYFEKANDGVLEELLIPLGEEMQMHVKKESNASEYSFDIIPIDYKVIKDTVSFEIENGCYTDLLKSINNPHLATYLKKIFSDYIDFSKLQKGDKVTIKYKQKSLKGMPWGEPEIEAAFIEHKKSEFFAVKEKEGYKVFINNQSPIKEQKKIIKKAQYISFGKPLPRLKVTSKFTYKRWHPILHRYRPHLGTDFRGKRGTPIYALASGKVIYAGWMRGYGKVVKIAHSNGFVSLYAHQSKIYVRGGERVKKGQKIGAVGNTGRSTGPHLHLSLYRYGKHKNPMKYINRKIKVGVIAKKVVIKTQKQAFSLTQKEKRVYNTLKKVSAKNTHSYKWKTLEQSEHITIKREKINANRVKLRSSKGAS